MDSRIRWILACGLMVVALLMHAHHVRYGSALDGFVLRLWPASGVEADALRRQEDARLESVELGELDPAQALRLEKLYEDLESLHEKWQAALGALAVETAVLAAEVAANEDSSSVREQRRETSERGKQAEAAERTLDQAIAAYKSDQAKTRTLVLDAARRQPHFGLLPSATRPRRSDTDRAFVMGLIVPAGLLTAALMVLFWRPQARTPIAPQRLPRKPEKARSPATCATPQEDGSEAAPLVVTDRDFNAQEHDLALAHFTRRGLEFHKSVQALISRDDRKFDVITYRTRPAGHEEWSGRQNLWFDITAVESAGTLQSDKKAADRAASATPSSDPMSNRFGTYMAGGTGKRDDPFVISETRDYVELEHVIANHILTSSNIEFSLEKQQLHKINGRAVDELVYAVKPHGSPEWTHRRRLFFDITAGFHGEG